jgi:dihydroxyacid dehydratase/phosphogluconate dehydratase
MDLLDLEALTVTGQRLGEILQWWETSARRGELRERLKAEDGIDPDDVIIPPKRAREKGLTSTVCFPVGNLAPQGSVIKATAIDPAVVDDDGVYRKRGPARVFTRERDAIAAIKGQTDAPLQAGDVLVLIGRGPLGSGMEETYQITAALKFLPWGREVAVLTDARFSGVSTGACIGHVGPEALAGGPIGKVRDGDLIEIIIDRNGLVGSVNLIGEGDEEFGVEQGTQVLEQRTVSPHLKPDSDLPEDTRLWAALQNAGGGTWGGCVYDIDRIVEVLEAGERALRE